MTNYRDAKIYDFHLKYIHNKKIIFTFNGVFSRKYGLVLKSYSLKHIVNEKRLFGNRLNSKTKNIIQQGGVTKVPLKSKEWERPVYDQAALWRQAAGCQKDLKQSLAGLFIPIGLKKTGKTDKRG